MQRHPLISFSRKKLFVLSILLLGVGFAVGSITAGISVYQFCTKYTKHHHLKRLFRYVDKNSADNLISFDEIVSLGKKIGFKLDENKDGYISHSETPKGILRWWQNDLTKRLKNNGKISLDELSTYLKKLHQKDDLNNDGLLGWQEFKQGFKSRHFELVDRNKDGVISKQEFINSSPPIPRDYRNREKKH